MRAADIQSVLDALPAPALAIDGNDLVVAANPDALSLVGGQIVGRNYVAMLRQPVVLDVIGYKIAPNLPGLRNLRNVFKVQQDIMSSD